MCEEGEGGGVAHGNQLRASGTRVCSVNIIC